MRDVFDDSFRKLYGALEDKEKQQNLAGFALDLGIDITVPVSNADDNAEDNLGKEREHEGLSKEDINSNE